MVFGGRTIFSSYPSTERAIYRQDVQAGYYGLRARAEDARLASENARLLLELHREEHGC
jgi:hypothetical protein